MNTINGGVTSPKNTGKPTAATRGISRGGTSLSSGTITNGSSIRQTAAITGNMLLSQLEPGSTFSGDIIDVRGSAIKILLSNDKTLDASSSDSKNLNIGDHIKFNVTANDGKTVMIKPLSINNYNTNVLLKALEAAEVPTNDRNIEVVKAMMRNEMSIDKNSLSEMIKKVDEFKTDNPSDVVEMVRHEIPLTQENVGQFAAYKNYEHRIMAQAESIGDNVTDLLKDMLTAGDEEQTIDVAISLVNILSDGIPDEDATVIIKKNIAENVMEDISLSDNANENIDKSISENPEIVITDNSENIENIEHNEDIYGNETILKELGNDEEGVLLELSGQDKDEPVMTKGQVLTNLNTLKGDELKEFLDSPEFKRFVKDKAEKGFELNVNKLGQNNEEIKENVKRVYKNLADKTEAMLNVLQNANQKDTPLANTVTGMRNNMQFMQDLSQLASYIQLPVKLNESKAHGELYVYNRKKGMPIKGDTVTAFLHLDLDNLGATDVHVSLENKSLKTQFALSDDTSMKIVEAHLHELQERLEKKGFITNLTVELDKNGTNENPFDKVLENDMPQISIKRYSFDVRA